MKKENIIRKLTSRKLWVAVAGFVSGLIIALDGDAETAETVSGLIMSGATALGYLLAEGLADAAHNTTKGEDSPWQRRSASMRGIMASITGAPWSPNTTRAT